MRAREVVVILHLEKAGSWPISKTAWHNSHKTSKVLMNYFLSNSSKSLLGTCRFTAGPISPSHSKRYLSGVLLGLGQISCIASAVLHG